MDRKRIAKEARIGYRGLPVALQQWWGYVSGDGDRPSRWAFWSALGPVDLRWEAPPRG